MALGMEGVMCVIGLARKANSVNKTVKKDKGNWIKVLERKKGTRKGGGGNVEIWPTFAMVSDCVGGRSGKQEVQQTPVILISATISTARLEQNPETRTQTVHACSTSPGPCLAWGFEPLCQLNLYWPLRAHCTLTEPHNPNHRKKS